MISRERMVGALVPLVGRILIALPLIKFGSDKVRNFVPVRDWLASVHVPAATLLLALADTIELLGALFLIVGFRVRWTALVLALYLILVHITIHNFWGPDIPDRAAQIEYFGKGMMIIGGLLFVVTFGPGNASIDAQLQSRKPGLLRSAKETLP